MYDPVDLVFPPLVLVDEVDSESNIGCFALSFGVFSSRFPLEASKRGRNATNGSFNNERFNRRGEKAIYK